jgi:hypothetical protein
MRITLRYARRRSLVCAAATLPLRVLRMFRLHIRDGRVGRRGDTRYIDRDTRATDWCASVLEMDGHLRGERISCRTCHLDVRENLLARLRIYSYELIRHTRFQ